MKIIIDRTYKLSNEKFRYVVKFFVDLDQFEIYLDKAAEEFQISILEWVKCKITHETGISEMILTIEDPQFTWMGSMAELILQDQNDLTMFLMKYSS